MTKDKIIETIFKYIPYSNQITKLNTTTSSKVKFEWRGSLYVVDHNVMVDELKEGMLVRSDKAILISEIIQLGAHQ